MSEASSTFFCVQNKRDSPFPSSDCIYGRCQQCCDVSALCGPISKASLIWDQRWHGIGGPVHPAMGRQPRNQKRCKDPLKTSCNSWVTMIWKDQPSTWLSSRTSSQQTGSTISIGCWSRISSPVKSCLSWILLKTANLNTRMKSSPPTSTSSKSHSILWLHFITARGDNLSGMHWILLLMMWSMTIMRYITLRHVHSISSRRNCCCQQKGP